MSEKITVSIRKEDLWILDVLDRIVEAKQAAGIKTSLSWELVRCAKNGLTNGLDGAELDKKILQGANNDSTGSD
jgi:hypothetical protein